MNITLSAEDRVIEEARIWAAEHGTSVNALVREYLSSLGETQNRDQAAAQFIRNAREGAGRSAPETAFKRSDIYTGRRFGGIE